MVDRGGELFSSTLSVQQASLLVWTGARRALIFLLQLSRRYSDDNEQHVDEHTHMPPTSRTVHTKSPFEIPSKYF